MIHRLLLFIAINFVFCVFSNASFAQSVDSYEVPIVGDSSADIDTPPKLARPKKSSRPPADGPIESVVESEIRVESHKTIKTKEIAGGFTIGHLMTPAVSTMKQGEVSVGTMFAGVGVTDKVSVGISPWMYGFYNMHNAFLRYQAEPKKPQSFGLELAYFKTDKSLGKTYQMEAGSVWAQYRFRVSRFHRVHLSLNYMHFQDDTIPFSLKRFSFSEAEPKGQWTFTTLQEIATTATTRVSIEFGVLGMNYQNPNYHFGASTAFRFDGGYIQFGLSATGYITNVTKSAYNQVYKEWHAARSNVEFDSVYKNSVAVHPEIQLQLFF